MIIVEPMNVQPADVTSSNVPLEAAWTAGTYLQGDQRRVGDYVYEVVADPSTTDEPTAGEIASPPTWLNVGLANRYRAFDGKLGRGIVHDGDIVMTIQTAGVVDTLYLYGIYGTDVRIEVFDGAAVASDETFYLVDNTGIDNIWAFIYEPITPMTERIMRNLPAIYNSSIRITISALTGTARLGEAVLGRAKSYGKTLVGLNVGIIDFSVKEADEFGDFRIVERAYSDRVDMDVVTTSQSEVQALMAALKKRRAKATLYIGTSGRTETYVYGYYRSWNVVLETPNISQLSIEIEGVT